MADTGECSSDELTCASGENSKKRKRFGRMSDVMKRLKLQSHETGEPCKCARNCFDIISEYERKSIIKNMNSFKNNDEMNLYLSGLITLVPVQRRRARKTESEAGFRDCSAYYRVKIKRETGVEDIPVCKNAFVSLNGITRGKVDILVSKLKKSNEAPRDLRGLHKNHPYKMDEEIKKAVHEHINSFPSRNSHYSLKKSERTYLDDSLNIKKMFQMFKEKYSLLIQKWPNFSYESYRSIFNLDFNIGFGYPRSDTCSTCDKYAAEKKTLSFKINEGSDPLKKQKLSGELKVLETYQELHLRRQQTFYERKKIAKQNARKSLKKEAITMDYCRNFPCPNLETNDVYYKRQLSVYIFNIHALSNSDSCFYVYPQNIGNKGADEVCSFLFHYIFNILDSNIEELEIFCDSCAGQNKNSALIKFCHYMVSNLKRLKVIKITYPIRGHSYLECDKNTALIKKKARCEIPDDWCQEIECSRVKPTPFVVVRVEEEPTIIKSWTDFLDCFYEKKLSFPTRPIREILFQDGHTVLISLRSSFNGPWQQVPLKKITMKKKRQRQLLFPLTEKQWYQVEQEEKKKMVLLTAKNLKEGELILPEPAYTGKCSISSKN